MIHGTSAVLTAHSVVKSRFRNQDCLLHRQPLDTQAWLYDNMTGVCAWRENNPSRSVCKTHTHVGYTHMHAASASVCLGNGDRTL